jgi:hypothetical protein
LRVNDKPLNGLRAIRPAFLGHFWTYPCIIVCSEINSSFLEPLGKGSLDEVKGFLGLGAELLPLDGHF